MERQQLIGQTTDNTQESCIKQILNGSARVELFSGTLDKWIELHDVMMLDGHNLDHPDKQFTVHYYNDVTTLVQTEKHLLQLETTISHKMTHDSVTGMFQTLSSEVSRSRRYNNPLSIVLMTVDYQSCSAAMEQENIEQLRLMISQLLKDQIRWADIVGHLNEFDFVLLLPETVYESAEVLIRKINDRLCNMTIDTQHISYGISQWQKGDDVNMFLNRAANNIAPQAPD
ncbi:MAG: diguanylate cyclase [gamma proteobacterium symbiont of Lucinoma myriamae]|nr:diguanylate cyclase [gamma proteobacterium symbiont of Lucinoma myriamae]MCU7819006.1 diguanylate cyclase [gamma proteobacterium symbiont of Lucinoma myriamae]MCU7832057.1 diguanylate cyclase [gamma proteobacterium symbiont of Lucinoma myriamae]